MNYIAILMGVIISQGFMRALYRKDYADVFLWVVTLILIIIAVVITG